MNTSGIQRALRRRPPRRLEQIAETDPLRDLLVEIDGLEALLAGVASSGGQLREAARADLEEQIHETTRALDDLADDAWDGGFREYAENLKAAAERVLGTSGEDCE